MEPLELIGPLGIRRFHLARACETWHGEPHNYDHLTIVIKGAVLLPEVTGDVIHGPGDMIVVPAHVHHTVKAVEPGSRYYCLFSHRDFGGFVCQEYIGNPDAYGHDRLIEPTPKVVSQLSLSR